MRGISREGGQEGRRAGGQEGRRAGPVRAALSRNTPLTGRIPSASLRRIFVGSPHGSPAPLTGPARSLFTL